MNLDGIIVKKLVKQGGLAEATKLGLTPAMLFSEGRDGLAFVTEHFTKYGTLPDWDTLVDEIPAMNDVDDNGISEPLEYLVDKVLWRFRGNLIQDGMAKATNFLSSSKPDEAMKVLGEAVSRAQEAVRDAKASTVIMTEKADIDEAWADYQHRKALGGQPDGLPTPWPAITNATMGIHPGELWFIVARLKTGKCIDGDTLIPDPVTGEWRTIKQVYETRAERGRVLTLNNKASIEATTPTEYWDSGIKECVEVVTRSGFRLTAPPNDPLFTPDGWVKLEDLKPGVQLAVAARVPEPECPEPMPDWEVDLLAGMIAEGGTTGRQATFTNLDPAIVSRIKTAVASVDCQLKQYRGANPCEWVITTTQKLAHLQKTGIRLLMEKHGLWGVRSTDKSIPNAVFKLPNSQLARFLGMLWSCDGSVHARCGTLTYGVVSKRCVEQVRQLLLRFGISCVLREKSSRLSDGRPYVSWELTVKGESKDAFVANISLVGAKAERIKGAVPDRRHPVYDYVTASSQTRAWINDTVARSGKTWADFWAWCGWSSNKDGRKSSGVRGLINPATQHIPRTRLRKFVEFFKPEGREELTSPDIWWDEIASIKPVGRRHVYDLTIDGSHNFVAAGVIAHNTWALSLFARETWEVAKKPLLFVTMEMQPKRIRRRLHALCGRFPWGDFLKAKLNPEVEKKYRDFLDSLNGMPKLVVVGSDRVSKPRDVEMLIEQEKPGLVIIDGVYFMSGKGDAGWERLNDAVTGIQRMAIKKNVPILASSQFNKGVGKDTDEAQASDIGYAYGIAQAADVLMGIYRTPELEEVNRMKIELMETRDTPKAAILANWNLTTMDFTQAEVLSDGNDGLPMGGPAAVDAMSASVGTEPESENGGVEY